MWLRLAVVAAAITTAMTAQTWEAGPVAGYLRLSKKDIGSANSSDPQAGDTNLRGKQPAYGAYVARNTKGYYGFEATYLRSKATMNAKLIPTNATDRVAESGNLWLNQFGFNGICYFMPKGERWRPFVTAGFQLALYGTPHLTDWPYAGSAKAIGFNFGGGVKIRLFKNALFRLDARDMITSSPYDLQLPTDPSGGFPSVGLFRQLQGTAGIGITF